MAGNEVHVSPDEVVDEDDQDIDAVTLNASASEQTVLSFTVKTGYRAWIEHYSQSVDPGGDAYVRFSLRRNGVPVRGYSNHKAQKAEPWRPDVGVAKKIYVGQGDTVSVVCANDDPNNPYGARVRIVVRYYAIKNRRV